jgi:hypothetical protein
MGGQGFVLGLAGLIASVDLAGITPTSFTERELLLKAEQMCSIFVLEKMERVVVLAHAGDQRALACITANQRYSFASAEDVFPADNVAERWVYLGYLTQRVLGEPLPEGDEAVTYLHRMDVIGVTFSVIHAMGGPLRWPRYDDGCEILNEVQLEWVRRAKPDAQTDPCLARWGIGA